MTARAVLTVDEHWEKFERYVGVAYSITKDVDKARDAVVGAFEEVITGADSLQLTESRMAQRVRWRSYDLLRRDGIETVAFEHFEFVNGGHPTPEQLCDARQQLDGMVAEVGEQNLEFLLQCDEPLSDVAASRGMTEGSVRVKRSLLRKRLRGE